MTPDVILPWCLTWILACFACPLAWLIGGKFGAADARQRMIERHRLTHQRAAMRRRHRERARHSGPWMIQAPARPPVPGEGGQARTNAAASLAPLIYAVQPPPMTPQAAPSKHGADGTGTMPRIKLELGTTGEMRKLTDDYIRAIEAGKI